MVTFTKLTIQNDIFLEYFLLEIQRMSQLWEGSCMYADQEAWYINIVFVITTLTDFDH